MRVKDRRVACRARGRSPFGGDAVGGDLLNLDVAGQAVSQTTGVGVTPTLVQIIHPWPAQDLGAQRTDLGIAHRYSSGGKRQAAIVRDAKARENSRNLAEARH